MKVILLQNLENVGLPGEVTDVKNGYYRNYLGPRGLAVEATQSNIKTLAHKREKLKVEAKQIVDESKALADRLAEVSLTFVEKVGENQRLFGSVTAADIVNKLADEGFEIERRRVVLSEAIKTVGTHTIQIKLYAGMTVPLKVIVESEVEPEPEPEPGDDREAQAEAQPDEPEGESAEPSPAEGSPPPEAEAAPEPSEA